MFVKAFYNEIFEAVVADTASDYKYDACGFNF